MENFDILIPPDAMWIIFSIMVAYVLVITLFGGYFSRFNSTVNDFFYSGQRFSWWLPGISMMATGIGSYSYLKYSQQGLNTGMSSSAGYLNGWFFVPFFMFGWLPILYFAKIKSVPEYFERRFNRAARYVALVIILCYMFYYIGYNLYTIGIAFEGMFNFPLAYTVPLVTIFLGAYVTYAGQTGVIFTDLFQGIMLFAAGAIAILAGLYAMGGLDEFWAWLPPSHRNPFPHLTDNPRWNTSGLFWGDALAMSIAFTFMNQGFLMRYLTIKSVQEARKAIVFNMCCTLPLAALVVGGVGWIAKSILTKQAATGLPLEGYNMIEIANTYHTFIIVCWEAIRQNAWLFGFVIAALMAALMSTIDTLINACSAVGIYDIYKPLIKPKASQGHYLKAARWASVITTILGGLLVIWFAKQKGTLMSIHYKGIITIIPPVVATIFMGMLWPRFSARAACIAMVVGSLCTLASNKWSFVIDPLAWFVIGEEGLKQGPSYIYLRSVFGMLVTVSVGTLVTLLTKPTKQNIDGLTLNTIDKAMENYKGAKPNLTRGKKLRNLNVKVQPEVTKGVIKLAPAALKELAAQEGDLLYMADSRWWLGGLRSEHVRVEKDSKLKAYEVALSRATMKLAYLLDNRKVSIEKIM